MITTTSNYKTNIDKKLITRQRIFLVIVSIVIIISIVNIAKGKIEPLLAVAGFLLASIIGILLSRMFKIFWHSEEEKVVSKLDTLGTILLIIYIAIEIGRKWIFEHWLTGAELNAFGLIILGGLLLGRFLGTGRKIKNLLITNNKLS